MSSPSFSFLKIFFLSLFIIGFYSVSQAQNIIVTPYLQNGSTSEMSIMWETDGANDGFVDLGLDAFSLNNTVTSTSIAGEDYLSNKFLFYSST